MKAVIGEPVAEGVGRIPGFVNAYVVRDDSGTYVIDTTMSKKARHVVRAFERANVPISEVGSILLTHRHPDHISGAAYLEGASHAKVGCHPEDAPAVEGTAPPRMSLLMRLFFKPRPVAVKTLLRDGDTVGPFRVVFVPGHTAGEIALYDPARRFLFSGDSVCERNGALTLSAARYATDLPQAVRSLSVLRNLDVELLFPGHGVPVTKNVRDQLDDLIARAPQEFLGKKA